MTKKMTTIDANLVYKAEVCLSKLGYISKVSNRLQAIVAASKHGATKVCEVLDISRSTLHRWIVRFEQFGMDGLKDISKPSRSKLNQQQQAQIKGWVEANPITTLRELVARIQEEMGVTVDKSSVHRTLCQLGFSHITGRKQHYKSDTSKQEEFKKN